MSEQQLSGVDQSTPEQTQQTSRSSRGSGVKSSIPCAAEGKNPFEITKYERTSCAREIAGRFDEMENQTVRIAGRIMTWRNMGKASFIDLRDASRPDADLYPDQRCGRGGLCGVQHLGHR